MTWNGAEVVHRLYDRHTVTLSCIEWSCTSVLTKCGARTRTFVCCGLLSCHRLRTHCVNARLAILIFVSTMTWICTFKGTFLKSMLHLHRGFKMTFIQNLIHTRTTCALLWPLRKGAFRNSCRTIVADVRANTSFQAETIWHRSSIEVASVFVLLRL